MTWFMRQRQDFIRAHLETFGMIRRQEIVDRFEVTIAVASADLQTFIAAHPGAIDYDRGVKRYVYEGSEPIGAPPPEVALNAKARIVAIDLPADHPFHRSADQDEIERLRGLLIDPGSPPWEDARTVLVTALRKAGADKTADRVADAQPEMIPSDIVLNLIALAARDGGASTSTAIAAGFVMVPVEPTAAMIEAGAEADAHEFDPNCYPGNWDHPDKQAQACWAAMIAAAPKAASDTDAAASEADERMGLEDFAYDELWQAIADSTRIEAGGISISVMKFRQAIRALSATPKVESDIKATTLEADLRKAIGEAIDGFKDGDLHSEKIDAILSALLKRIYHTGSDAGRLIARLDVERACEMAAQVADREQRYEGSDFPVCRGIAREIRLIPAKMWAENDGKGSSNAG